MDGLLGGQSILVKVISIVHFCIDNLQYRIIQIICFNNNNWTNLTPVWLYFGLVYHML